ncbi:prohead protease/major capsid protein fusion protein [Pseudochelatococcus sp. G4_1912]|uniref:prohead protease/major capsid protein fusion protein n=1 Tax=Pseudochelatococcus sp. G4_1912 TaxID=3114288 RepID=UPI0039C74AC1
MHNGAYSHPATLPMQTRESPIADTSIDVNARTVNVVFTTGAAVRRTRWAGWDSAVPFDEVLEVSSEAIDLTRLNAGAPALDSHSIWSSHSQVGVVERAWIEGTEGRATIRFPSVGVDAAADRMFSLVSEGIVRNISVGYSINRTKVIEPENKNEVERRIVERWTPMEISFVTVPADPGAQVRSQDVTSYPVMITTTRSKMEAEMSESTIAAGTSAVGSTISSEVQGTRAAVNSVDASRSVAEAAEHAVRAERDRVATISGYAETANVRHLADEHIRSGSSVEAFRAALLDHLVAKEQEAPTNNTVRAQVGTDEIEKRRASMTEALSYGLGAPVPHAGPSEGARQYMARGLVDLAADTVGFRGGRMLNARQIDDIFTRASHTTSDFPIIFEGAINRALEQRYALAQPTFRRFAKKRNFRDFRPDTTVKLGDFPLLKKVMEGGEIKYGTFNEGKEQVQAFSYAIALRVTRQMLINDDLGAISELLASYGASVALFEEMTFYSTAFNSKLADGKDVFHADHNNLASAGTVIDVDNVGKARAAMSKQKSTEGNPLLANPPKILLTGPDKLTEAEKLLASITPATVSNVNMFSGRLEPLESSQLLGNAWYLLADPAFGSNYRWGYLEGYEAPRVRMDEPFGQQGFAMSVEHDFGCGATDFRFAYKNPGA